MMLSSDFPCNLQKLLSLSFFKDMRIARRGIDNDKPPRCPIKVNTLILWGTNCIKMLWKNKLFYKLRELRAQHDLPRKEIRRRQPIAECTLNTRWCTNTNVTFKRAPEWSRSLDFFETGIWEHAHHWSLYLAGCFCSKITNVTWISVQWHELIHDGSLFYERVSPCLSCISSQQVKSATF